MSAGVKFVQEPWVYAEQAPPHDLLKVKHWRKHYDVNLLPDFLRDTEVGDSVKRHHGKWESDMMSAALARQFFDGADYLKGDIDSGTLFFIPVYETKKCRGGVIYWDKAEREQLQRQIFKVYEIEKTKGTKNWLRKANRIVNELLSEFPADTWTPFSSLKAHHIMTWILHMQAYDEKTSGELIKSFIRDVESPELCILMFRFPERDIEFYKLRELRRFIRNMHRALEEIRLILLGLKSKFRFPILCTKIGDELITVVLNHNPWTPSKRPVEDIIAEISRISSKRGGVKCAIKVIRVKLKKKPSKKRGGRPYWVVYESPVEEEYYVGSSVREGGVGKAEWVSDMRKRTVAWTSIEPKYGLTKSCERFIVDYALKVMEKLPHTPGFTKPQLKLNASPDIMFTVMDGYERFLQDVEKRMKPVVKSFSRSIFVLGLDGYRKAFRSYEWLVNIAKERLHIPVNIGMVVVDSKFPFWRVLEILKKYPNNLTVVPRGGKMVSLSENDFKYMMEMIPIVRKIKPSVWENEIAPASAKSIEELDFELRRLSEGAKRKINPNDGKKILDFAKKLDENHRELTEEQRRSIRYAAFKRLSDFAMGK